MRIQTILNRVEKFKSFVYSDTRLGGAGRRTAAGGVDQTSKEHPSGVLGVWEAWSLV